MMMTDMIHAMRGRPARPSVGTREREWFRWRYDKRDGWRLDVRTVRFALHPTKGWRKTGASEWRPA